jgi:hypothetical protein
MSIIVKAEDLDLSLLKPTDRIDEDLITEFSKITQREPFLFSEEDVLAMEKEAVSRGKTELYSIEATLLHDGDYAYLVRTR